MYVLALIVCFRTPECPGLPVRPVKLCYSFDPGLGQSHPRLDDLMGFPDSVDIGFERPSLGSDDMLVLLTMVGDVNPKPREILPVYSIFRLLLGKDELDLVGVVLNKTDLAAVYHWSGLCSFASDVFSR